MANSMFLIKNVEIFRAGTYLRGGGKKQTYSADDIRLMAQAYNPLLLEAQISFDHTGEGESYGKIKALRSVGGSLFADLIMFRAWTVKSIVDGRWPARSVEIFPKGTVEGVDSNYIFGLSFLGAKPPAVLGLPKITSEMVEEYKCEGESEDKEEELELAYAYSSTNESLTFCFACDDTTTNSDQEYNMTEKEKTDEMNSKYEALSQKFSELEAENKKLKDEMKKKETYAAANEAYDKLFNDAQGPKITPAEKDSFVEVFSTLHDIDASKSKVYIETFSARKPVVDTEVNPKSDAGQDKTDNDRSYEEKAFNFANAAAEKGEDFVSSLQEFYAENKRGAK
jgi:hypothetical protein